MTSSGDLGAARRKTATLRKYLILSGAGVVLLFPMYILLVNALKTRDAIIQRPLGLPLGEDFTIENLSDVIVNQGGILFGAYATTIGLTLVVEVGLIGTSGMLAYYLARNTSRLSYVLYFVVVLGILVPPQIILLPAVQVLKELGLLFTVPGLIVYEIGANMPLAVFLYTGFIKTVPTDLDEAASLDGASLFRTYWSVIFPILRPATGALAIFIAIWVWNDFLSPLVILGPLGFDTVTTALFSAIGLQSVNYQQVYGWLWFATVPVLVVYIFTQRFMVKGLTEGAVS
jgi:raffinose/stachyose/melibiose transport system permease protein